MVALRQVLREHQDKHLPLDLTNANLTDLDALLAPAVAHRAAPARGEASPCPRLHR
jgi:hypothetical protein